MDGVEVSTTEGHYLAVGHHASAYPLGGEARHVVEDIARLGGFGVAAHPFSTKESLRWKDWTTPIDGIEWLNTDSGVIAYSDDSLIDVETAVKAARACPTLEGLEIGRAHV